MPPICSAVTATRTIRQTFLWFQRRGLELPVNQHEAKNTHLVWKRPSKPFIGDILQNPCYAGAYVWGRRPTERVVVEAQDVRGEPFRLEAADWLARAICHEIDHLDGVLFIDRLDRETRKLAMKAIREAEWFGETPPAVKVSPHAMKGFGL